MKKELLRRRRILCVGVFGIQYIYLYAWYRLWCVIHTLTSSLIVSSENYYLIFFTVFFFFLSFRCVRPVLRDIEMSTSNFELFKFSNVSKVQWQLSTNNENVNERKIYLNRSTNIWVVRALHAQYLISRISKYFHRHVFILMLFCHQRNLITHWILWF